MLSPNSRQKKNAFEHAYLHWPAKFFSLCHLNSYSCNQDAYKLFHYFLNYIKHRGKKSSKLIEYCFQFYRDTVCPRSLGPLTFFIKWVKTYSRVVLIWLLLVWHLGSE